MLLRSSLLILLFIAICSANLFPLEPVSTFIWSGQGTFAAVRQQELQTISEEDLFKFVQGLEEPLLRSQGYLEQHLSKRSQFERPEIVVIFVEPVGKWAHEAYNFLKPILDSSASSLVVPYSRPALTIVKRLAASPSVILSAREPLVSGQETAARYVPKNALLNHMQENKGLFSNGKTDILVVALSERDAAFVEAVHNAVQDLSEGRYLSIFTAEQEYIPEAHMLIRPASDSDVMRIVKRNQADGYWPRSIYEGLLAVIVMGLILIVGVGCLTELQTPTKWEKTKRNIREVN